MHVRSGISAFVLLLVVAACSDDADVAQPSSSGSSGSSSSGSSGSSSSSASSSSSGGADGGVVNGIPTSPTELNAWLQKKPYKDWSHESAPHASAGPHPSSVLAYVNPELEASLKSGAKEHPAGAAAVKEFLGADGVTGWAVSVKTDAASNAGQGWYWYETFDSTPGAAAAIEGQGKSICVNCHSGGTDYSLTPFPLN